MKLSVIFSFLAAFVTIICLNADEVKLINHGKKQYIGDSAKYEELAEGLYNFQRYCNCKDVRQKFESFFKMHKPAFNNEVRFMGPSLGITDYKMPYKERSKLLKEKYADEIKYIQEMYKKPLKDLEAKYIAFADTRWGDDWPGFFVNPPSLPGLKLPQINCYWHQTVLAQRGSTMAQLSFGFYGDRYKLTNEQVIWVRTAAQSDNIDACWMLGKICLGESRAGRGKEFWKNAADWFKRGAELGNVSALPGDVRVPRDKESRGASCLYEVGVMGLNDCKDPAIALPWFRNAATKDHIYAVLCCASIYAYGTTDPWEGAVKRDLINYRLAVQYFEQAINLEKKNKYKDYEKRIKKLEKKIQEVKLKIED